MYVVRPSTTFLVAATLPATSPSSTPGSTLQTDLAVDVLTVILRAYLAETSMDHLAGALKKGGIKDRTDSVLDAHFRSQVVDWWTRKQNTVIKEDIAKAIKESLEHEHEHERRRVMGVRPVRSHARLGAIRRPSGQGGVVEKKRKREVRSRDATASRGNIGTNAKSKGRNSEPSHRVNQTLFLVSWNGSEETHEINTRHIRLLRWPVFGGESKLGLTALIETASTDGCPNGSRTSQTELRPSNARAGAKGIQAQLTPPQLEGWPMVIRGRRRRGRLPVRGASLREKNWRKGVSKRSSEPTHKVNQTEGSEGVEDGHMTNTELKRRSKRIPPQSQPDSESMVARERWPADRGCAWVEKFEDVWKKKGGSRQWDVPIV
ncbi:hypothetical protein EDB85DRAFT_1895256 [Lactarius pseudohatsudake]|nr:hypothetical protein EDB85DRAFT_1895256 [Lactarius pseudohatsudake]